MRASSTSASAAPSPPPRERLRRNGSITVLAGTGGTCGASGLRLQKGRGIMRDRHTSRRSEVRDESNTDRTSYSGAVKRGDNFETCERFPQV